MLALHAAAQMTVTNTGTGGSSGIQMTNGSMVSASGSQVSIWADQGTSRGILNNGGFASVGPLPIAVWPCTSSANNPGAIVYGAMGTTGTNGYLKETCLSGNNSGSEDILSEISGVPSWIATTGSGSAVLATGPVLSNPSLGAATATTINKVTLTQPTTGATLTIANGKTLTANNSITLAGTDSTTVIMPTSSVTLPFTLAALLGGSDTISCSASEQDFLTTYTLPASYLTTNKLIRVTILMSETDSGSPSNVAFNLKMGGTNVYTATLKIPALASLSNVPTGIQFYVQGTAAPGASVNVFVNPVTSTLASPFASSTVAQPVALATNGTLVITPGWTCNNSTAGNSATLNQLVVESLN
jgi:hypothetical protein